MLLIEFGKSKQSLNTPFSKHFIFDFASNGHPFNGEMSLS